MSETRKRVERFFLDKPPDGVRDKSDPRWIAWAQSQADKINRLVKKSEAEMQQEEEEIASQSQD